MRNESALNSCVSHYLDYIFVASRVWSQWHQHLRVSLRCCSAKKKVRETVNKTAKEMRAEETTRKKESILLFQKN